MPVHRVPRDKNLEHRLRQISLRETIVETHEQGNELLVVTTREEMETRA